MHLVVPLADCEKKKNQSLVDLIANISYMFDVSI